MLFKIYDFLHKRVTAVQNDAQQSLVHNKWLLRMSVVRNVDMHTWMQNSTTIYEGCSKNNGTCIGAHIAEVFLFILICSVLQNTLRKPEHTFLAGQSIFGSIFILCNGDTHQTLINSRSKGISRTVSPSR